MATITVNDVAAYNVVFDTSANIAPVTPMNGQNAFPTEQFNGGAATQVGQPFTYTAANWTNFEFRLASYVKANVGTVYVDLYDITAAAQVSGSLLSTSSSTLTRFISPLLTLVDTHVYIARIYRDDGASGQVVSATIVARQT